MINYEDELEDILLSTLKEKFEIDDEEKLFTYLAYRYSLIKNKKVDRFIMDFILYELNASSCVYKEIPFENNISASINNLNHIYENWKSYFVVEEIKCKKYREGAKGKARRWKDSDLYDSYLLYYQIQILNNDFHPQNHYVDVPNLLQKDRNKWESLEDSMERLLHIEDDTTTFICENDLEDYLIQHLDLIEDGLQFISRQFVLPEGRIDILARDIQNNIVVIELKIDDDKKIVWQSVYYRIQMEKQFLNRKIRILTIMKEYPEYLLEPLIKVNVEPFEYDLIVKDKTIKTLDVRKVVLH